MAVAGSTLLIRAYNLVPSPAFQHVVTEGGYILAVKLHPEGTSKTLPPHDPGEQR